MTSERHALAKDIFLGALSCPPAERAAFLERRCGSDSSLRGEVEQLLAHHDEQTRSAQERRPRSGRSILLLACLPLVAGVVSHASTAEGTSSLDATLQHLTVQSRWDRMVNAAPMVVIASSEHYNGSSLNRSAALDQSRL